MRQMLRQNRDTEVTPALQQQAGSAEGRCDHPIAASDGSCVQSLAASYILAPRENVAGYGNPAYLQRHRRAAFPSAMPLRSPHGRAAKGTPIARSAEGSCDRPIAASDGSCVQSLAASYILAPRENVAGYGNPAYPQRHGRAAFPSAADWRQGIRRMAAEDRDGEKVAVRSLSQSYSPTTRGRGGLRHTGKLQD